MKKLTKPTVNLNLKIWYFKLSTVTSIKNISHKITKLVSARGWGGVNQTCSKCDCNIPGVKKNEKFISAVKKNVNIQIGF